MTPNPSFKRSANHDTRGPILDRPTAGKTAQPTDAADPTAKVPELVRRLYTLVAEFEALFPGRRFTPDGHLVGSIGEVLAAYRYALVLHRASNEGHDAEKPDGRQVEIKATQDKTVALRAEPEHLIVLQLGKDGGVTEVFNGPGALAGAECGAKQKNGQRPISVSRLQRLMHGVGADQRIPTRA